jgi:hypothetical protein
MNDPFLRSHPHYPCPPSRTRLRMATNPERRGAGQMEAELAAKPADRVIEKSTCNAFFSGELDRLIRSQGIRHLAIWVGYHRRVCPLDAAGGGRSRLRVPASGGLLWAVNGGLHRCAIESVKAENGVFGTVTNSRTFIRSIVGDDGESRKPAERGLPAMARATRTRRQATGQGSRGKKCKTTIGSLRF